MRAGSKDGNKFDRLDRDELMRRCLELEAENEQLRPKPALYKLGQLLAYGNGNQWMPGQPAVHFTVLSVEHRNGEWHYGYKKAPGSTFITWPERKLRPLTPTEIDGTPAPASEPVAVAPEAIIGGQAQAGQATAATTPGIHTVGWHFPDFEELG